MSIVLRILLVMWVLCSPAFAQGMKDGDRQRLLAHLDMTENWLVSELDGLTTDQLNFHMSPESWNILEVVEHLAIAEPQYWEQAKESMRQPPSGKRPEASDAGILWYGIDRTNRSKTGEARVPKGKWKNVGESLAEFRKLRRTIRDYAASTREDPRSRMLLEGNMDVYQWLLMISSHAQRHILQIREIKSHSGYPRPAAK
jgi:DinB family protein